MRQRRDGDQTAQQGGNTGKALGSGNTGQLRQPHGVKGDSQEGLNRHGARNLTRMRKATYKRVLIGMVYVTLGEGCRGNTGQLDEDLTVLQKGGT